MHTGNVLLIGGAGMPGSHGALSSMMGRAWGLGGAACRSPHRLSRPMHAAHSRGEVLCRACSGRWRWA